MIKTTNKIYLDISKTVGAGRGVFAVVDIEEGEIIEICPIIEFPQYQVKILQQTKIVNYYFLWGKYKRDRAIALGFGSLYNHSYSPNATYKKNLKAQTIEFISIKPIKKDEEILVNYNQGNPNDKSTLWIKDIKPYVPD